MKPRFFLILPVLVSLAVALALPACRFMTDSGSGLGLTPGRAQGGGPDSVPPPPPPPPPSGISIGVSDDSMATAGHEGYLRLFAQNHDAVADTVNYRFTGPEGWPGFPATGSLVLLGGTSATVDIPVSVPAGTAPGVYLFHYEMKKPDGTTLPSGDFPMIVHPG